MTATLETVTSAHDHDGQDGQTHRRPEADTERRAEPDLRTQQAPGLARRDRPSVLLVEDEADLRRLVRRYLERDEAFEVAGEAENGRQALELVGSLAPDIILLDLVMPVMDGREALPRLVSARPSSMIVVLSALDAIAEEQPALSAGAFAYVEKTQLGASFGRTLAELHRRFVRALDGQTVWAPEPPGQ